MTKLMEVGINPVPITGEPIAGKEDVATDGKPYAALAQFYRAFNRRDLGSCR